MNATTKGRSVDELLRSVSASRISTFLGCKLKFYFQYVAGLSSEKSGARLIGSGVHEVLRKWNLARWRKQVITTDALKLELARFFDASGVKWQGEERQEQEGQAWSLIQTYLAQTPIPPNEAAEGVEVSVEADLTAIGLTKLLRPA